MSGINSEKNNSSSGEIEYSDFDDISEEHLNVDKVIDRQNTDNSVSPELARRLSFGEKLFRDAIGLPDNYHISAEHKILFSAVSDNPVGSNFPSLHSGGVFFDVFGLEVDGTRYPFSSDHQIAIHENILKHELSDVSSVDEIYQRLDSGFSMYFAEHILQRRNTEEVEKELNSKRLKIVEKKAKLNMEQRGYREHKELEVCRNDDQRRQLKERQRKEFVDFILSNNILSKDELKRYEKGRNFSIKISANSIASRFNAVYQENYPKEDKESEEEYTARLSKIKSHINELVSDYLNALALSYAQSFPEGPESKLFDAEWTKQKIIQGIVKLDRDRAQRILRGGHDVDYFKKKLYEGIDSFGKLENIDYVVELLRGVEQKCSDCYGSLRPRYVDALIHYKEPDNRQITELEKRIEYIDKNRTKIIEQERDKRTQSAMGELQKRFFDVVCPESSDAPEDVVNFYFIPTGVITRFKTGSLKTTMITPFDERILGAFDDEEIKNAWINAWSNKQADYNKMTFDILQRDIRDDIALARDEVDNEIMAFGTTNQIQIPEVFDMTTGRVYGDLQPDALRSIEPLIPDTKDFIYGLDISTTEVSKTLRSTRLEILNFLSGDSDGTNLMLCGKGNLKINSAYELLNNTELEKQDKAYSRLLSEIGIMLYNDLTKDKTDKYRELIGDTANVSDKAFYKAYGKMIPNQEMRRKIVERTVFLKDFIDYIENKVSPVKAKFFDSLRKKPALEQ